MSDLMHVPIAVRYHQESHAIAGALVGLGMDYALKDEPIHPIGRIILACGTALAVGAAKEAFIDKSPHRSEIPPWGWGAASALAIKWTF